MNLYFLPAFIIGLLIITSCKPEELIEEPPVTIAPQQVVFAPRYGPQAYSCEVMIPWNLLDISPQVNVEFGFEALIMDDDDGGLVDDVLGWHRGIERGQEVNPSTFGTLRLKEDVANLANGEAGFVFTAPQIDGNKDQVWESVPAFPIEQVLTTPDFPSSDLMGTFQAIWDSAGLYLRIDISDDSMAVDSWVLGWEDDGIALYFDPHLRRPTEVNADDIRLYRIVRNSREIDRNDFVQQAVWTIPIEEVLDGGPGKDGIPALLNPAFVPATQAGFMRNNELVLGYFHNGEARAYPHSILDWHEIINDELAGQEYAITYCPLTGTGIGWDRKINGESTTFGVSGLLYNTNLIPYDRATDSHWSQIRLDCLNGSQQGKQIKTFPLVETTWKSWKEMFPDTKVVSRETGYSREYDVYPYGDYRTDHDRLIFPVANEDARLERKTRVHGIIANQVVRIYPFERFQGGKPVLIHDEFQGRPIVVIGSLVKDYIVSYGRELSDGTLLSFTSECCDDLSVMMKDQEGNRWNIFGEAVSGPRQGSSLPRIDSYIGYWFSFAAMFPEIELR
ncbi:MAG: DUF3179 domain-containing (seleno)protein [Bacteroidota bacterium]